MKIGLCTIARREDPLADVVGEAAAIGFDGIEVWGRPPHLPELTEAAGARAAEVVRAAGLEPAVFGSYLRPGSDEFAAELQPVLAACRGYGAPLLRVWAGSVSDLVANEDHWRRTVDDFRRLLDAAGELIISVERHGHTLTESTAGAQHLLTALDDPRLTLNFQYQRGLDTAATIAEINQYWPRISNVHAQNVRDDQPAALCQGELDYGAIVAALAELGYEGYLEIEFVHTFPKRELSPEERHALLEKDYRVLGAEGGAPRGEGA